MVCLLICSSLHTGVPATRNERRSEASREENGERERKNACRHPRVFFVTRGLQRPRISIGLEFKLWECNNLFTRNKHGVRRCGFDREDSYVKYELKGRTGASCVRELQKGNDVLAVLPTGFGKSRIFKAFRRVGWRRVASLRRSFRVAGTPACRLHFYPHSFPLFPV